jgi:muramoyltetrapeptide carboxypeptidase
VVTIKIIRPASRESNNLLPAQIDFLRNGGFQVVLGDNPTDPSWTYTSGSAADRAKSLQSALTADNADIILCARGGYGCSDLLPLLDWKAVKAANKKLIIGFSDISALQAALYNIAGWPSLHAPMPATSLWRQNGDESDIQILLDLIRSFSKKEALRSSINLERVGNSNSLPIEGRLFGGCFTVLTNLIGTAYMPKSLKQHILFIEDTDEHPARLMRALNQWLQTGLFDGLKGLVIGHLRGLGANIPDCAPYVYEEFAKRCSVPVFKSKEFGHTSPNMPLMIGSNATISLDKLSWHHSSSEIS